MKASKLNFLILSLPMAAFLFPYSCANAALRINNSSLIQERAQLAAAAAVQPTTPQPARTVTNVTNENGETVNVSASNMAACNAIYPNGKFAWAQPTTGYRAGGPATCVALVELISTKGTVTGNNYPVLARAYLAAGDGMKCNIDYFPDITAVGRNFEYPADQAPTMEDVQSVMAQENRQNLGFKILSAALVGGIGGNLLTTGDADHEDSAFNFSGDKLKGTLIGAAGSAAVMTASSTAKDYKTGSIILSTGVNSVAGAVAGNLNASGDDVLNIRECNFRNSENSDDKNTEMCLYGALSVSSSSDAKVESKDGKFYFYNIENGSTVECDGVVKESDPPSSPSEYETDQAKNCHSVSLKDVKFKAEGNCANHETILAKANCIKKADNIEKWCYDNEQRSNRTYSTKIHKDNNSCSIEFLVIESAKRSGRSVAAKIKLTDDLHADMNKLKAKMFGYTSKDWKEIKKKLEGQPILSINGKILCSDGSEVDGNCGKPLTNADIKNFTPAYVGVDDSEAVDFGNKARTKSTLIGAAGGAGLGALAGAAGADAEITERWLAAQREYDNSMGNAACMTGERWLGRYNESFVLPEMRTTE